MSDLTPREEELVALGAAIGSNCIPCVEYHIRRALELDLTGAQLLAAIDLADRVRQVPAKKVLEVAAGLVSTVSQTDENSGCCG